MATILANAAPVLARVHSRCLALDHSGEAIYARPVCRRSPACRRDGFTKARVHPYPEAAVRKSMLRVAVPVVLALSGCHLLDQTDFAPKPPSKPAVPPVPNPETRAALVTIDFAKANTDYRAGLSTAIHAAETMRPGSLYDVVAYVPAAAAAAAGRDRAAEVMTAIEADGVIAPRIQLGLVLDAGQKIPQVRVYLR
jgi:hypothetical protein